MRTRRAGEVALYGNVAIKRGYCYDCKEFVLILAGKFACCDRDSHSITKRFVRESQPEFLRKLPPIMARRAQILSQRNKCLYCRWPLDGSVLRNGKRIRLKVHWDHRIPFSYGQNNAAGNFVAACQICNGIKSDKFFEDLDDAKTYIMIVREKKGYAPIEF